MKIEQKMKFDNERIIMFETSNPDIFRVASEMAELDEEITLADYEIDREKKRVKFTFQVGSNWKSNGTVINETGGERQATDE